MRNIRIEAPTFDGSLEPKVYVDWVGDMDYYFEWYEMSEGMKYKFAKMRLIHQARLHWANLERTRRQRALPPITTWQEMKLQLKEKYLPESYNQQLLDQWNKIHQGNRSVSDYIAEFDEFAVRCSVTESLDQTLSRFRIGLHEDIKRELYMREVHDLEQAYQIARHYEQFQRGPTYQKSEPIRNNTQFPRSNPNQVYQGRPNPNPNPGRFNSNPVRPNPNPVQPNPNPIQFNSNPN